MKKSVRQKGRFLLVVGLLLFCIGAIAQPRPVQAAVSKAKVRKAYEKQLKTLDKKWKKQYANWGGGNYFCYYDVNKDGVEECLAFRSFYGNDNTITCTGGTDVAIYTYYGGKVKQLAYSAPGGGNWGYIGFRKDSKYITFFNRGGIESRSYQFKAIKKGKLATVGTCEQKVNMTTYKTTYKVRKKAATQKSYESFIKKMEGTKGVTMYKITTKNLQKFA